MADRDTLSILVGELGAAIEPLNAAFQSPGNFSAFMHGLGWEFDDIPAAMSGLAGPLSTISSIVDSDEIAEADVPTLLASVAGVITTINGIPSQPAGSFPAGLDVAAFKSDFPGQIVDFLVAEYLLNIQGSWGYLLKLLGVIRVDLIDATEQRPEYFRRTIAWNDLANFFSDPSAVLRNAYRWGQSDFLDDELVGNARDLLDAWRQSNHLAVLDPAMQAFLTNGAIAHDNVWQVALQIPFVEASNAQFGVEAGFELLILPETAAAKPGFAVVPYAHGDVSEALPLTDEVSAEVSTDADLTGGVAIIARPGRPVDVSVGVSGEAPAAASGDIALALVWTPAAGTQIILIGSPDGSRLQTAGIVLKAGAHIDSAGNKDLFFETQWSHAALVIKPGDGEADSFLASLLPADGLNVGFDFALGISTSRGVYFAGSGGLEISLPVHVQLGPVEVQSALLAIRPSAGTIPIELSTTISGDLSVLTAVVENIGLTATFTFPPGNTGNLGPTDLRLGFKPPNGVGLALNAGVIKGGGYLFLDSTKGEYAGALELVFTDFLTLTAIGLIDTRLPDGSPGYSLLIIITADFGEGIQLGFGFTLLGVGGLVGLNRTVRLEPLMEGVRTGAVNGILFPQNVIANAPRIISDLRAIFPPAPNSLLIGPMAKVGWGTPPLISLSIGIIIQIPGNIAVIGVLRLALPTSDAPLIVLQVNFAGAIEFDRQRVCFFAALFESRVLFIPIEGEMGVLAAFGADANFVVSVGGFHPQFTPPPLPFPAPNRVSLTILSQPTARIRVDGYFAVTANTAQFGAHAELVLGFDSLGVQGQIAFDALFQFSPFHFVIQISASLSANVFGAGVFSVRVSMTLSGPTPWRALGTGSISLFFFDISVDFSITWGEDSGIVLPPIAVLPLVKSELEKPANWTAILPPDNNLLVSLRTLPADQSALVLHPVGVLRISQKAVPLGIVLDKVGTQTPCDVKDLALSVVSAGLKKHQDRLELFAPAQFRNMSDADKLSQPAFTPEAGGIELSAAGAQRASSEMARRDVRYERIIIDTKGRRFVKRFYPQFESLFSHFVGGASASRSALSQTTRQQYQPFTDKVRVASETFTVAFRSNNQAFGATASFTSQSQAADFLARMVGENPDLSDTLHVIPAYEVAA